VTDPSPDLQAWEIAVDFLLEAERFPVATVPRMTMHAAYYAMFHAARAVLLRLEGLTAPSKHNVVIGRFGYHAKQANDPAMMAAGRTLNAAQKGRLESDYEGPRPSTADAETAVTGARAFLETCSRTHGFPSP
jgi:uncharacterized protein (UPF0332 family)